MEFVHLIWLGASLVALAAGWVYTARHGSGPPTPLADSATTRP